MATVPRLNAQVQERGFNNQQFDTTQSIEAFGGGEVAAAPTKALQQTVSLLDKERQHADNVAFQEADKELNDFKNYLLNDPDKGLISKRGKDALGAQQEFEDAFKKKKEELSNRLSWGNQRSMFEGRAGQHESEFTNSLNKHTYAEAKRFEESVYKDSLNSYAQSAVNNYNNPEAVAAALDYQKQAIVKFAADNGMGAEYVDQRVKEITGATKASIIQRQLINGQDQEAKAYFEANKDTFDQQTAIQLEKLVNAEATKGDAMRIVDDYTARGYDLQVMMNKAKEIENPDIRKEVEQRAREFSSLKEAAKNQRQSDMQSAAINLLAQNGGNMSDPAVKQYYMALDPEKKNNLDTYAKNKRDGKYVQTDMNKYYDLQQMAGTPELRDSFLKEDLNDYINVIDGERLETLRKTQASLRKGDTKEAEGLRTKQQIVKDTAELAGIKNETKQKELMRAVESEIMELEAQGKTATKEDVQRITDQMTIKVVTKKGFFWDTKDYAYELEDGVSGFIKYDDMPSGSKASYKSRLAKIGIGKGYTEEQWAAAIEKVANAERMQKKR